MECNWDSKFDVANRSARQTNGVRVCGACAVSLRLLKGYRCPIAETVNHRLRQPNYHHAVTDRTASPHDTSFLWLQLEVTELYSWHSSASAAADATTVWV